MEKKSIAAFSVDAKILYDILRGAAMGDVIPYSALTDAIGRNVQGEARGLLYTAQRKAQAEDLIVFDAVRGVGLRRLSDVETVTTGEGTIRKMHRVARRGLRRMTTLQNYDALPNDAKIKHNTYASAIGAISMLTRADRIRRVEARVTEACASLPLAKTLEAFRS